MRPPLKQYFHKTVRVIQKPFLWVCRPPRLKSEVLKFRTKLTRKKSRKK